MGQNLLRALTHLVLAGMGRPVETMPRAEVRARTKAAARVEALRAEARAKAAARVEALRAEAQARSKAAARVEALRAEARAQVGPP